MHTYEGLFLLEPTVAAKEWDKAMGEIQRIIQKANAQMVANNKWGERKLAYAVRGHKRGTYLLAYVKSDSDGIAQIRRECELSDIILRVLFLRFEGPIKPVAAPQELPVAEESWSGGRRDYGRRRE